MNTFTASSTAARKPARQRIAARLNRLGADSSLNLRRFYRENLFERTHTSFWAPNLLDRLTLPLSRYHE